MAARIAVTGIRFSGRMLHPLVSWAERKRNFIADRPAQVATLGCQRCDHAVEHKAPARRCEELLVRKAYQTFVLQARDTPAIERRGPARFISGKIEALDE